MMAPPAIGGARIGAGDVPCARVRRRPCDHAPAMPTSPAPTAASPPEAAAERERVLRLLRAHAGALRARGITRPALFGSVARGGAEQGSDVDLLIEELDRARHLTLFDLVELRDELRTLLGRPAHFAFATKLRPWPHEEIGREAVEIFR